MPPQLRRAATIASIGLSVVLLTAAGRAWFGEDRGAMRREIRMRGNSFSPRELRIAVGDTVVWVNSDIVRHNAVRSELFDSGELRAGERFAWVPTDTGTVRYQCTIHSRMRGTIVVKESR